MALKGRLNHQPGYLSPPHRLHCDSEIHMVSAKKGLTSESGAYRKSAGPPHWDTGGHKIHAESESCAFFPAVQVGVTQKSDMSPSLWSPSKVLRSCVLGRPRTPLPAIYCVSRPCASHVNMEDSGHQGQGTMAAAESKKEVPAWQ